MDRPSPELVHRVLLLMQMRRWRVLMVSSSAEVIGREAAGHVRPSRRRAGAKGSSQVRRGRAVRDHVGWVGVSLEVGTIGTISQNVVSEDTIGITDADVRRMRCGDQSAPQTGCLEGKERKEQSALRSGW